MAGDTTQDSVLTPLNKREIEILRLLAEGCSNAEIGQKLYLTVETIKWYNKQIFSKLGVASRTQAVARANELGLFDAPDEFAPDTAAPPRPPHNLPVEPMPFIGRTRELSEVAGLVADPACRLVTLVGPGGIGKTRLGLKVAEQHLNAFAHGVFFVPLAGVDTPESVIPAVAEAIKFRFRHEGEPKEQLIDHLSQKQLMLVLDNFEQLLSGAALVADVVAASPGVQVIATSRARLNLAAECAYPVDGMNVPPSAEHVVFEEVEAVQLFTAYARRARPDFTLNKADKSAVVEICKLVGGMPLGIELAAAWVRALSPGDIAQELEAGLDLLAGEMADLPERQRSIRATFEYSWKMLTAEQKSALGGLAVFRGGFTREAAKEVAGVSITALGGLVDQSLIKLGVDGRYDIHELIRQFGEEKLAQSGEETATRRTHAAYFVALAEQAWEGTRAGKDREVLARVDPEMDNIRAMLAWSLNNEDSEAVVRAAASLGVYYEQRGLVREGADYLERALAMDRPLPPRVRAFGLRRLGLAISILGSGRARFGAMQEEALAIYRELGDQQGIAMCLNNLAHLAGAEGDYERAQALFEEALALHRARGSLTDVVFVLNGMSGFARLRGDLTASRKYVEESIRLARESTDELSIHVSLSRLVWQDLFEGGYDKALTHIGEMTAIDERVNSFEARRITQMLRGITSLRMGNPAAARVLLGKALSEAYKQEAIESMMVILAGLAATELALGDAQKSIRLFGVSDALGDRLNPLVPLIKHPFYQSDFAAAREELGDAAFEAAWAAGRAMRLDEAVAYALEEKANV